MAENERSHRDMDPSDDANLRMKQEIKQELYNELIEKIVKKLLSEAHDEASLRELYIRNADAILSARKVAHRTGNTTDEVISLAMTLYETALDAHDRGERLVLLTKDYKFVQEIIGLVPKVASAEFEKAGR